MSFKRLVLGIAFLVLSLILIIPKPALSILNWGIPVASLLLALIPAILIVKGSLLFYNSWDGSLDFRGGEDGFEPEEETIKYEEDRDFEAKGNWKSEGHDIWQGTIKGSKLRIEEDVNSCHYAKKFSGVGLKKIKVTAELPEDEGEAFLIVATGDEEDALDKLDEDSLEETEKKRA